ncbi:MAG: hypothetical protein JJU05_06085 [Verrucomicrobia bacterium]|nr:hypothetical protein [Verrucomicrobiota bacterium]MCH8526928.1 hypothetical protein [Kiritimatiellia bacterium]
MRQFLLSSFPSLQLQEPAPLKLEDMLSRCSQHLSETELDELGAVCSTPPEGNSGFARDWAKAWGELKNLNDRERVKRLPPGSVETPPADNPHRFDRLRAEARHAWDAADPLKREEALLLAQWSWLDERRRAAPYSQDDLLAYALQLKLLELRDAWNEEAGTSQFAEQTDSFMNPLLETLRAKEERIA